MKVYRNRKIKFIINEESLSDNLERKIFFELSLRLFFLQKKRITAIKRRVVAMQHLRPIVKEGHPFDILVRDALRREMLRPLQYSYYTILETTRRNPLFDVTAIASLFVNIDVWFEVINDIETLRELIVEPLAEYRDIRTLFP